MGGPASHDAIRLQDLSFTWAGRSGFSLSIADFRVAAGEKLFLHGESGSGKSTLLSLIAGIAQPQSGRVEVDGVDLAGLSGPKRDRFRADRIGIIFQMFNLLPFATGLENILLPLSFSRGRRAKARDPKTEALRLTETLGLDGTLVATAPASELSIGQQQRVAAARALIGGPKLVIADEPTSALDANAQGAFLELLMQQVDALGATLLMVSHDERLADRFDRRIAMQSIATPQRSAA